MASRCSDPSRAHRPVRRGLTPWLLIALGAVAAVTLAASQAAPPQTPSRDASQRAAERIRTLQREADALARQESTLLVQLRRFEVERQLRSEELGRIERDRAAAEQALAAAGRRVGNLQRTRQPIPAAGDRRPPGARIESLARRASGGSCSTWTIFDRPAAPTGRRRR